MKKQRLTVLGSTGSIGTSTLDVVARHPERFEVFALSAATQVDLLLAQCAQFRPRYAVMASDPHATALAEKLKANSLPTQVIQAQDALEMIALHDDVDAEPKRPATMASCHELLNLLSRHNAKEEAVIYPQVGPKLDDAAAAQVSRFLETGTAPDRWTPARASG